MLKVFKNSKSVRKRMHECTYWGKEGRNFTFWVSEMNYQVSVWTIRLVYIVVLL